MKTEKTRREIVLHAAELPVPVRILGSRGQQEQYEIVAGGKKKPCAARLDRPDQRRGEK